MPASDCCFLIGYLCNFVGFILFVTAFATHEWMIHDEGSAGLWRDCISNNHSRDGEEDCSASAKAEGPVWLEQTRMFMCLALVCEFVGFVGYNWCPPSHHRPNTYKDQIKARLQELSCFIAGVLTMMALVSYGFNFEEYYAVTKDYHDVKLGFAFHIAISVACIAVVFSIVTACARNTGLKSQLTKQQRSLILNKLKNKQTSADTRKVWLQNKKLPTPTQQKEKDVEDLEIVVKKDSKLKRIVTPTNVILAVNRLKSGIGRKQEQEAIDTEEREIEYLEFKEATKLDDAEGKLKGIFTIEGESQMKPILSPPSSTRRSARSVTSTPRSVRIAPEPDTISTTSSSSLSSSGRSSLTSSSTFTSEDLMVTAEGGAILPSANATAAAVEDTLPPRNTTDGQPQPQTLIPQRQKVRRAMTTLQDNPESRQWATTAHEPQTQTVPSKLKPKRHFSHDALETHRKQRAKPKNNKKTNKNGGSSSALPGKNIYTLPTDQAHSDHLLPSRYEEVIGSQHSHQHQSAPQPVLTAQSNVFQPYSKS